MRRRAFISLRWPMQPLILRRPMPRKKCRPNRTRICTTDKRTTGQTTAEMEFRFVRRITMPSTHTFSQFGPRG
jgi:hypothetical protein